MKQNHFKQEIRIIPVYVSIFVYLVVHQRGIKLKGKKVVVFPVSSTVHGQRCLGLPVAFETHLFPYV